MEDPLATCARPVLGHSQLAFRLGLARKRSAYFPLDSLDFILMDVERPGVSSRHAHHCTGDLSGRLLEFLSATAGIESEPDPRLESLFERILRTRRPSGFFGRYATSAGTETEEDPFEGSGKTFHGFLRYYMLTRDARALEAAAGIAERIMASRHTWHQRIEPPARNTIANWVTEPFARLYGITRDSRYLDMPAMIAEHLVAIDGTHSHGFMSTLRGLQLLALCTGDTAWNEKPERFRRTIIDEHYETPDGCVSEAFARSWRNEGCSIADWVMLNLNAGLIAADDVAYERAENALCNALYFNQFVTGGFGCRELTPHGYAARSFEEAWWCCLHEAGLALTECARHAVTLNGNVLRINLLVPGQYTIGANQRPGIQVSIRTGYPATGNASIEARGLPEGVKVHVRVPSFCKGVELAETVAPGSLRLTLRSRLGHYVEKCDGGVMLKYGPLVLAPSTFFWSWHERYVDSSIPEGYIPQSLPTGVPELAVGDLAGGDGLLHLPNQPLPVWSYFEEGPVAPLAVGEAAVNVPLRFPGGERVELRFWPLCYNTSNMSHYETPIIFAGVTAATH